MIALSQQDEVLFDNWDAIFNGGTMKDNVPIYSFDGKDVLHDSTWYGYSTTSCNFTVSHFLNHA